MKKANKIVAAIATIATVVTMTGCTAPNMNKIKDEEEEYEITGISPEETVPPPNQFEQQFPPQSTENNETEEEEPPANEEEPPEVVIPKVNTVQYLAVTASGVNIRSGAGTSYTARGTAEKSTMYALNGQTGSWYKTGYKNNTAYISSNYCEVVEMTASDDERIEAIIAEGTKLLGTAYVFGAVRYHDGNGNLLKNFTTSAFDCSSLMQYIFYMGAHYNLQLTTRTQIYQGKTVTRSQLQRGDLMFFTNASRKNNTGIERVGHVALYLGDNWILHTASDYAKIEQISATRWSYFIQGQRIF